jgi:hypothetical protein
MEGLHRGIRLVALASDETGIPFLSTIAAGRTIEAVPQPEYMQLPGELRGIRPTRICSP